MINHKTTKIHTLEITDDEFKIIMDSLEEYYCNTFISDRVRLDTKDLFDELKEEPNQ